MVQVSDCARSPECSLQRTITPQDHRIFVCRPETDSFVFFFFSVDFVLEYADLSNQRDIFLHGSLVPVA